MDCFTKSNPHSLEENQKTKSNPVVAEDVFGLIALCGVIEMQSATENLRAGFPDVGIVNGEDQRHMCREIVKDQREDGTRELFHVPDIPTHEPVDVTERADEPTEAHRRGHGTL